MNIHIDLLLNALLSLRSRGTIKMNLLELLRMVENCWVVNIHERDDGDPVKIIQTMVRHEKESELRR